MFHAKKGKNSGQPRKSLSSNDGQTLPGKGPHAHRLVLATIIWCGAHGGGICGLSSTFQRDSRSELSRFEQAGQESRSNLGRTDALPQRRGSPPSGARNRDTELVFSGSLVVSRASY